MMHIYTVFVKLKDYNEVKQVIFYFISVNKNLIFHFQYLFILSGYEQNRKKEYFC